MHLLSIIFTKIVRMDFIFGLDIVPEVAKKFPPILERSTIITFSGQLGAGKTTMIKAICEQLGVREPVTSPTYAIVQEYLAAGKIIYHLDLYRLKSLEEARDAGIDDYLNRDEICLVEWPEIALSLFPQQTVFTTLETISADNRKMVVQLP